MIPHITTLHIPNLIDIANSLSKTGRTQTTENNLSCLKIEDAYVHQLFHLLEDKKIKKPDYFGNQSVGAHITIIYPEENKILDSHDLYQEHRFTAKEFVSAKIGLKTYYVILVESPSLLALRKRYGLPDMLCFKGYLIGFHITIGVCL